MSEKGTVMIDQRLPNREEIPVLDNAFRQLKEDTERQNKFQKIDDKYDTWTSLSIILLICSTIGILFCATSDVGLVGALIACVFTLTFFSTIGLVVLKHTEFMLLEGDVV